MNEHTSAFVRSTLTAKSLAGQRENLLAAFLKRRVLQECQEAIPGFVSAEVLLSLNDPDELTISVLWRDQTAWQAWQDSEVRLQQTQHLAPLLACEPVGQFFVLMTPASEPTP